MKIVLLHPGAMGASLGAALRGNGHDVLWVPDGRSAATRRRAREVGLRAVPTLAEAAAAADIALAVCPPEAAVDVASAVYETAFAGLYVDGNAIAPATAQRIAERFGDRYVDGGIIGPPALRPGATRFYLSGNAAGPAQQVAALFEGSLVDARCLDAGSGCCAASALKMCYAAFTKGSSALLLGVRALAARAGVEDALLGEWDISQPALRERSAAVARGASPKAWRFAGEMREIAATFGAAGLPSGFHEAAATLYSRMAGFKDAPDGVGIDAVVQALLEDQP